MSHPSSRRYETPPNGEWGPYLDRPAVIDTDSAEVLATEALVTELGFSHFLLVLRFVLPKAGPIQATLSNWPREWDERYWARDCARIDPVAIHMLRSHLPFDWRDAVPRSREEKDFIHRARRFGMADGIAGAVRFGSDQAGFFHVSSTHRRTRDEKENAMARVFLHAARVYERIRDQLRADHDASPLVLTSRQREALHWTMRGASRSEASRRMRCSESNFAQLQEAARRKLGESTNVAAVRKAVALDLIRAYETVDSEPPPE